MEQGDALSRGSDRIFNLSGDDPAALAEAIGAARNDFQIKWWWKFGRPAIDVIKGGLEVNPQAVGGTLQQLIRLNADELRVNFEVFPIGVVAIDAYQVQLEMRQVGRG